MVLKLFRLTRKTLLGLVPIAAGVILGPAWFIRAQQEASPPNISNIQVDAVTHSSARVGWVLSKKSRSSIEYGRTTAYGYRTIELDPNNEMARVWLMTGMAPATEYHFRVKATDESGAVAYSDDQVVTTKAEPPHPVMPELPREYVDTMMPRQTGATLEVDAECSNFNDQLQRAVWGDTIIIPAGTTCKGHFVFPAKPEDTQTPHRWIVIRTSAPDNELPPEGVRIDPSWGPKLARLAQTNTRAPYLVAPNAHHYRFIGIEFTTADPEQYYEGLLRVDSLAHHIVIDRCYLHGFDAPGATRRGLTMEGSHVALIHSYLTINNWKDFGFAFVVDSGPGPGKIYNNFIQGPGITMFWTDNVNTPNRADYEIRRNWLYADEKYKKGSPTSDGRRYVHRQPLELKRGRRFLIDGNVFENWWADEQGGSEIMLFTPRGGFRFDGNEYGISDITISNNLLRKVPGGIAIAALNIADAGGYAQTQVTKRFRIANNLALIDGFHSCCGWAGGARGLVLRIHSGVEDLTFEHNTVYRQTGSGPRLLSLNDEPMEGLIYRNNIVWYNNANNIGGLFYIGNFPTGSTPPSPKGILDGWAVRVPTPFYDFSHNVIPGAEQGNTARNQGIFPPGNFWPGDGDQGEEAIQFVDAPNGNFYLRESSPYKRAGTDGRDIGTDIGPLEVAIGRVQHVRVEEVGTDKASVTYFTPDSFSCTVELSPNEDFSGAVRRADPGGEERTRLVGFEGLTPGTRYFYRVLCASEQPQGQLVTATEEVAAPETDRRASPGAATRK
jgi:hypothetical protein